MSYQSVTQKELPDCSRSVRFFLFHAFLGAPLGSMIQQPHSTSFPKVFQQDQLTGRRSVLFQRWYIVDLRLEDVTSKFWTLGFSMKRDQHLGPVVSERLGRMNRKGYGMSQRFFSPILTLILIAFKGPCFFTPPLTIQEISATPAPAAATEVGNSSCWNVHGWNPKHFLKSRSNVWSWPIESDTNSINSWYTPMRIPVGYCRYFGIVALTNKTTLPLVTAYDWTPLKSSKTSGACSLAGMFACCRLFGSCYAGASAEVVAFWWWGAKCKAGR